MGSVEPKEIVSLIIWDGCSKIIPCTHYVGPPIIIEFCLLLVHSCVESTLRLAYNEAQPLPGCKLLCGCCSHKANSPQQGLVPVVIPWDIPLVKLIGSCSVVWSWPCDYWFWASSRGLWCRPMSYTVCDRPWATYLELSMISSFWLPLLALGACGKARTNTAAEELILNLFLQFCELPIRILTLQLVWRAKF